jgi:hypothetical protein
MCLTLLLLVKFLLLFLPLLVLFLVILIIDTLRNKMTGLTAFEARALPLILFLLGYSLCPLKVVLKHYLIFIETGGLNLRHLVGGCLLVGHCFEGKRMRLDVVGKRSIGDIVNARFPQASSLCTWGSHESSSQG